MLAEYAHLRKYLFSEGGYERIEQFADRFLAISLAMDGIKPRNATDYETVWRFAWDQGLNIGVLEVIGEWAEADRRLLKLVAFTVPASPHSG
jgi:hypothetical protein